MVTFTPKRSSLIIFVWWIPFNAMRACVGFINTESALVDPAYEIVPSIGLKTVTWSGDERCL